MRSGNRVRVLEALLFMFGFCLTGCGSTPSVYWTELAGGTVNKVVGNAAEVNLAANQPAPAGIDADAYNIYWASPGDGTIKRVPIAGGSVTTLASGQAEPIGLAVDSTAGVVYWTNTGDGTIRSVSTNGGAVSLVAQGQMDPLNLGLDANNLYWTDPGRGTVMKCPKQANCNPVTLSSGTSPTDPALPWGIAVDASNVYWTDSYGRTVYQLPVGGGIPLVLASFTSALNIFNPAGIAIDSTNVYWVDSGGDGSLNKVPIGGGTMTRMVTGQYTPLSIAVSDANIYWGDYGPPGQINKIAKNCTAPCAPTTINTSGNEPAAIVVQNVVSGGISGCEILFARMRFWPGAR